MPSHSPPGWTIHPFLRIAPPFILGVVLGNNHPELNYLTWAVLLTALVILLAWSVLEPVKRWVWKPMTGTALYLVIICTGYSCSMMHRIRLKLDPPLAAGLKQNILVRLEEVSEPHNGRYRIRAVPLTRPAHSTNTRFADLLLYIDTIGLVNAPADGDLIALVVTCRTIRNNGNPGEPDMASIQAAKGLTVQAFVRAEDLLPLEHRREYTWANGFTASREWIERILHRYMSDSEAADLAATLITGHRAALDPELLRAYADTGVVHVIAISGLHLGMIHGLLIWLLSPLFRRPGRSNPGAIIVLPLLWIYACFTGASASVIRSAAMFTGIGFSGLAGRRQRLLNGLGSSAVVLLACRPDWIEDIGFQLSYAALLSIALYQPTLRRLLHIRNPMGVVVWDMVSVTLAAQLLTAPLVAWHFHRLPLLFLFSNLPVVPLSSMVLLLGMLICAFQWLAPVASLLGGFTTTLIHLMNGQVMGIDAVPWSAITNLQPDWRQVTCLYAMIALTHTMFRRNWLSYGGMLLLLLLAYQGIGLGIEAKIAAQRALIVFQLRRQSLYAIVEGPDMLILMKEVSDPDTLQKNRCISQAILHYKIRGPAKLPLGMGTEIAWRTKTASWKVRSFDGSTELRDSATGRMFRILTSLYIPKAQPVGRSAAELVLVADASCALWKIQQWKSTSEGVPSRFHSVPEQGAFVMDMNSSFLPTP